LKLKVLILLTLALLVFSTPVLVNLNVSMPKPIGALWGITKNHSPLQPCGDPVDGYRDSTLAKRFCLITLK
jgi:hypothetical protein